MGSEGLQRQGWTQAPVPWWWGMGGGSCPAHCQLAVPRKAGLPALMEAWIHRYADPNPRSYLSEGRQPSSPCSQCLLGSTGIGLSLPLSLLLGPKLSETQGAKAPDSQGAEGASGVIWFNPSVPLPDERLPRLLAHR